jgi:hypothetical protein
MDKGIIYSIAGSILGSIIEEGIEELFPGVGELDYQGEIAGAIAGLLGSQFTKEETQESFNKFVKFCYKKINDKSFIDNIPDDELELFSKKFNNLPKKQKLEIINNFKNLSPYEYDFIKDFLKGLEGA